MVCKTPGWLAACRIFPAEAQTAAVETVCVQLKLCLFESKSPKAFLIFFIYKWEVEEVFRIVFYLLLQLNITRCVKCVSYSSTNVSLNKAVGTKWFLFNQNHHFLNISYVIVLQVATDRSLWSTVFLPPHRNKQTVK